MKKRRFIWLFLYFILFISCNQKDRVQMKSDENLQKMSALNTNIVNSVQVIPNEDLQRTVDSIISLNAINKAVCELTVEKGSEYIAFMTLHIGTDPFYEDDALSVCYFLSKGHKVKIYSGMESYFNLPEKLVKYGRIEAMKRSDKHQLWIIQMYKDCVVDVYSTNSANPFLLPPAYPISIPDSDVFH